MLPTLATWQFALAGAVCAAGPIILHLLNRRRFRVVEWAAMQFLREAMQRSRRIMQVRDLVLLVLRTAAVLLFGLALARPFFTARGGHVDASQPVHAVLLIDNSLSMGLQSLEGTLLEKAKQRAAAFIDRLPAGSRVSILPLCGSEYGSSLEPFDTKPFALEALQRITVVDRSLSVRNAITESRRAAELSIDLAKRFVLFSDQQRTNWSDLRSLGTEVDLPDLQFVDVAASDWSNTWVEEVRVQDGVADSETPTTIAVEVRHHGTESRGDVRVALWIHDQEVDSQIVTFETSEGTKAVTFEHTFREVKPEPSRPTFVPIKVAISPDRLAEDDERYLLVPVVAVLPVVFVDQHGEDENPAQNRLGETRHLRHLLAPSSSPSDAARQLVQVRHRKIDELDRDLLADARLVVIAGVADPGDRVELLREYVEQGGQLVLAAGAEFDAGAWQAAGWLEGHGILPLPLLPEPLGALPELAGPDMKPLFLSFESLGQHPYFQLAGNAEDDLRDLYSEPFFFQAVRIDEGPEIFTSLKADPPTAAADDGRWLLWTADEDGPEPETQGQADAYLPRVLARFTNETGPAYLVERQIGRGRVLFAASGLLSSWNTLPKTNAIVVFDRILRDRIQSTLPQRNHGPVDRLAIALPNEARDHRVVLTRPGHAATEESLDTGFLRQDQVGVTIANPLARGVYEVKALGGTSTPETTAADAPPRWQLDVAVNGDAAESDLEPLAREQFDQQAANEHLRWIGANEEISLAGSRIRGQDLWWWLAAIVFGLLLAEIVTLLWPTWRTGNVVSTVA